MRAHLRPLAMAVAILAAGIFGAAPVAAAGPAPGEACVAGTVWTDLESGVKWLCIYDEQYGGTRWELLSTFLQVWSQGWLSRSMTTGCTLGTVAMTALGGSGADAFVRSYRWPCATTRDRVTQPPGDLRVRTTIQHYNGSWITCRDTGYAYNTVSSFGWRVGVSMGTAPDCGTGYYRSWGYASVFDGGAWRGGTIFTPILQIR